MLSDLISQIQHLLKGFTLPKSPMFAWLYSLAWKSIDFHLGIKNCCYIELLQGYSKYFQGSFEIKMTERPKWVIVLFCNNTFHNWAFCSFQCDENAERLKMWLTTMNISEANYKNPHFCTRNLNSSSGEEALESKLGKVNQNLVWREFSFKLFYHIISKFKHDIYFMLFSNEISPIFSAMAPSISDETRLFSYEHLHGFK